MSEAAVLRSTMTDRATITREAWNGTAWERVVAYEGLPCALSRAPQTPTASITGLWEEVPECQGQMSLFVPRDTVLQAGDRVLSKEIILSRIWGFESNAVDNHVEVYVGFLRKKLASIGSNVKIVALRRLGYHLEVDE